MRLLGGHGQVEHIECDQSCRLTGARGEVEQLRLKTAELHWELAETRAQASMVEQRLADLTAMLDDGARAQADQLSSALTDQRRKAPPMVAMAALHARSGRPQITHVPDNPSDLKSG
jgi:uncharacterized coiled-coil DUF342 family protein